MSLGVTTNAAAATVMLDNPPANPLGDAVLDELVERLVEFGRRRDEHSVVWSAHDCVRVLPQAIVTAGWRCVGDRPEIVREPRLVRGLRLPSDASSDTTGALVDVDRGFVPPVWSVEG
jgi:hypothetical protein